VDSSNVGLIIKKYGAGERVVYGRGNGSALPLPYTTLSPAPLIIKTMFTRVLIEAALIMII